MIERFAETLRGARSVALIPHVGPDGDAMGSTLALMFALRGMGVEADVVSHDAVPSQYAFMPGADRVVLASRAGLYDAAAVLDVSDTKRIGAAARVFDGARLKLCADHHRTSNPDFCEVMVLDREASSTGNIVRKIISAMGAPLTREIAECLFVAVSTDTGHFSYDNVTGCALRDAAALVDTGIDVGLLTRTLYRTRTEARTRLIGRAIADMRLYADGRVAAMRLSNEDFALTGAHDADSEGIINYAIEIEGVKGAVLGRETDTGIKISLRGLDGVDVSRVAQRFGGGGHRAAAGCIIDRPLDEAVEAVTRALAEAADGRYA